MSTDEARRRLRNLGVMRLLHVMPVKEALRVYCQCTGEQATEKQLYDMRLDAILTFQKLFGPEEEPFNSELYKENTP